MNPQIDKQNLSNQKELKAKLLSVIAQHPKGLTRNEMLIKSGISQDLIDYSLRAILEEYSVHLNITDNQQVIYVFDIDNPKNKKLNNASQLQKALQKIGRILIFLGAILLAISWVVMAIPIAFTILGLYLVAGFFHIFFNQGFSVGVREYMTYWMGREDKKDRLLEEKVILSYIVENKYCITIAELVKILDWSYDKAEQEAVWLLVNYGGEPIVDESGVIIYDFTNLKEDESAGKSISQEYVMYQRNKNLERLEYRREPIEVSKVDVFSCKRWDRHTYLTMKVYLMNYYLGAVLFLGTLVGSITIWRFNMSDVDMSIAINGGRPMTSEEEANMRLTFVIFCIGYIITVILATVVLWRWFAVQIPAKKAEQIAVFKSILYEYIFEKLPQNNLFQIEMLLDALLEYRIRLPKSIDIKTISANEVIQAVLTELKAEPTVLANGRVAHSLAHIAEELEVIKQKRESF